MTASRPDLLPFALPTRIGLPWHGLVRDGVLQVDSGTKAYVAGSDEWSSATLAVRHSEAAASLDITDQPDEDADHRWQNYALLSGDDRSIGGQDIGSNRWLYSDANRTWVVYWTLTGTSGSVTAKVYLEKLFGVFGAGVNALPAPIELASYTFASKDYTGATVSSLPIVGMSSHSLDGSKTALNVFSTGTTASTKWPQTAIGVYTLEAFLANRYLHDILTISLSGNGSTQSGTVGAGISATISHTYDAPALQVSHVGTSLTADESYEYKQVAAMSHAGALVEVTKTYARTSETVDDGLDEYGYTMTDTTVVITSAVTFGSQAVALSATATARYSPSAGTFISTNWNINGETGSDETYPIEGGPYYAYSLWTTSRSLELLVLRIGASMGDTNSYSIKAIGKQGHELVLDGTWDPGDQDITYDSVRGLITEGAAGERLVYV